LLDFSSIYAKHPASKGIWDMSEEQNNIENGTGKITAGAPREASPTRRRALMLGAVGAATIVSVRPALAQAAGSVLNCEIPMPNGTNLDAYGKAVPADTPGSFPTLGQKYTGEQVKKALSGRTLPGTDYNQSQAYVNYIRRLQNGQSGFTCYASLQMPR
jgi:hypothetical protein